MNITLEKSTDLNHCTLTCLIVGGGGGSNKLKWVAFSENNRPKTKNYTTRSYKILQKPEFTPRPYNLAGESICHDIFQKPLMITECEHTFCGLCLTEW